MEITVEFIDKVVYYKGRVWTVYGTNPNHGIWAYNGVKPYSTFKFDSRRHDDFRTTYIPIDDAFQIIEGEDIDRCLKLEAAAEKKKLNKKYAVDFFVWLTGHSKSFVTKNIEERHHGFLFVPGSLIYEIWKTDKDCLILSHNTNGGYTSNAYFDYVTWEPDEEKYEKSRRALEREILENHGVVNHAEN